MLSPVMNTFKVIRMAKRPAQHSAEAFRQDWNEAQLNVSPPPARTVLSVATGEVALGGQTPPFDGMAALYYQTLEEAHSAGASMQDEIVQVCDEHLMSQKPNSQTRLKIIRTVYRRRDLTHEQFKDYWLKNHSRLEQRVIAESPVQRIVATFAIPQAGKDPAFDGMVELYFASVEDIRSMFAGPIPAMMRKDEENFVQMDAPAVRLVAEEFIA
jgi:uncharacterized protein (TIGR02118 family)